MDFSPRLSLPYLAPQQAQKHVTVNESIRRLDALVQLRVASRSLAAEPATPAEGDAFILPAGKTGTTWSRFADGSIAAFRDDVWIEIAPADGFLAFVADEAAFFRFAGGNWAVLSAGAAGAAPVFGVNTIADATNRLAVKSDASLFNHDDVTPGSGDHRLKINKSAAAKTASVIFQDGGSGRAEIGLAGDDDLRVKVSADGSTWTEALVIDRSSGVVKIPGKAANPLVIETGDNAQFPIFTFQDKSPGQASISGFNMKDDAGTVQGQVAFFHAKAAPATQYLRFFINGAERVKVVGDGSVVVGAPTGGAKGDGTINAKAVYDDNALLSCYVFDAALDNRIDAVKWDEKAPSGVHDGARRFAERLGAPHDPLTLDGYAAHWREKRHLSSLPNEAGFDPAADKLSAGEWIQRLVETVEIQAVLIEKLNGRLKAVEER